MKSRSSSKIYVTVVGGSRADERALRMAEEVGRLVAQRGGILVTGGRGGVMEAACRGAKEAGGLTVGILPGESREEANPYVDVALPTGLGNARNALTVLAGDAVIVVGGEAGTLSRARAHIPPLPGWRGRGPPSSPPRRRRPRRSRASWGRPPPAASPSSSPLQPRALGPPGEPLAVPGERGPVEARAALG
jgi:uncharacterized protein (TIGR00725 family)